MIKLPAVNSAAVWPLMTKLTNDADVELDSFPALPIKLFCCLQHRKAGRVWRYFSRKHDAIGVYDSRSLLARYMWQVTWYRCSCVGSDHPFVHTHFHHHFYPNATHMKKRYSLFCTASDRKLGRTGNKTAVIKLIM